MSSSPTPHFCLSWDQRVVQAENTEGFLFYVCISPLLHVYKNTWCGPTPTTGTIRWVKANFKLLSPKTRWFLSSLFGNVYGQFASSSSGAKPNQGQSQHFKSVPDEFFECNPERRIFHELWGNYGRQYLWFSAWNNSAIAISQLDRSYLILTDLKSGISEQGLDRAGSKWVGSRFLL